MSNNISNNDDDLFNYDPTLDELNYSKSDHLNNQDSSKSDNVLFENIRQHLNDKNKDSDNNAIRLALGFSLSTHAFLNSTLPQAMTKSLITTLDSITHGDFSLVMRFYNVEMKISKRMNFHALSREIFQQKNHEKDSEFQEFFETIFNILNIEINPVYFSTCFLSSINISNHALMLDRSEYLVLSKKLNIPVKYYLLESTTENEDMNHSVFFADFQDEINQAVNTAISSDVTDQLKEIYSSEVTYRKC
jgi:hypothetical protein